MAAATPFRLVSMQEYTETQNSEQPWTQATAAEPFRLVSMQEFSDRQEQVQQQQQQAQTWIPQTAPVEKEDVPEYGLDISCSDMVKARMAEKCPLDSIIPLLPEIPDFLLKELALTYTPDQWSTTEHLKELNPCATIRAKKYLDQRNAHPWDSRIVFVEEPHRYYLDGSCKHTLSTTTFIGKFFPGFDDVAQSKKTFATKTFQDCNHRPSYEYYGCKSPEDILRKWKQASEMGTQMHANIESHFNNEPYEVIPENKECMRQFHKLFSDKEWVRWTPFRTEWSIFDPETLVTGQIDFCGMVDKELGHVVLLDWKRCKSISDCSMSRFTGDLNAPLGGYGICAEIENSKYMKYSLQLNVYKYILEKNYGLYVKKMYLIQLHPKNSSKMANVFLVPFMQPVVSRMFACRKFALKKAGII